MTYAVGGACQASTTVAATATVALSDGDERQGGELPSIGGTLGGSARSDSVLLGLLHSCAGSA